MMLKFGRIAVVSTAALTIVAATVPTKAEAADLPLPAAYGRVAYSAPPPPPCCQIYAPPPPPPCCVYGGGYYGGYAAGYGGGYDDAYGGGGYGRGYYGY